MILVMIVVEIFIFYGGIRQLNKWDQEAGLQVNRKESVILGVIFTVMELLLFSFYGCGGDFICHSLVLFYMISAAFIDHKTRNVYRMGSIVFILFSIFLFLIFSNPELSVRLEKIVWILVFSVIVILQGATAMMGWGDVLTYIGVFFWIGSWEYEYMTVELLAVYMLLSNVLFLIFHIREFDWKSKKMKEEAAFLPGMAGAVFILDILLRNVLH